MTISRRQFLAVAVSALASAVSAQKRQQRAKHKFRPIDAYASAHGDLLKVHPARRPYVRYLSFGHIPEGLREKWLRVLSFHVNALSRCQNVKAFNYTDEPALVRLNIDEFKWDPKVWEKLLGAEPYFHYDAWAWWPGGPWRGTEYKPHWYSWRDHAPYLTSTIIGSTAIRDLVRDTGSKVPVVRGDWFLDQTTTTEGKVAGYYEWLGIKDGKTFEKLIGAGGADDYVEYGATVRRSTRVAINNRQIRRKRALGGNDWFTIDVNKSIKNKNLLRNPDAANVKQASERIGALPNGLPVYELEDAKGVLQTFVPEQFAGNTAAFSPDTRVHAGILTCFTCHGTVLHPIKDYFRELRAIGWPLQTPDPKVAQRLEDLYVSDLQKAWDRDTQAFEDAINEASGLKQVDLSSLYGRLWASYFVDDVTLEMAADDMGIESKLLEKALLNQRNTNDPKDPVDPVHAGFFLDGLRRDQFEESFVDLMRVVDKWGAK